MYTYYKLLKLAKKRPQSLLTMVKKTIPTVFAIQGNWRGESCPGVWICLYVTYHCIVAIGRTVIRPIDVSSCVAPT